MAPMTLPFPPIEIANRVGSLESAADPVGRYDEIGRLARGEIEAALPGGWGLEGKRVLDFGCGPGRTLRHFVDAYPDTSFAGCDIDAPSIDWLAAQAPDNCRAFLNGETPPLDSAAGSFDLVYAVSVFTHLTDSWSAWLLELHRVLAPGGLLVATFMGEGMAGDIAGEAWDEDRVGMLSLRIGQSWDLGGPMVLHSPWWLREHWGRAFEVVSVSESGFCEEPGRGHGVIVLRKDDRAPVSREQLERSGSDPREAAALGHNVAHLARECVDLRWAVGDARQRLEAREKELGAEVRRREAVEKSRSYQLTRPLRQAAAAARRLGR
jgi:SAM-dependent methyltransferase